MADQTPNPKSLDDSDYGSDFSVGEIDVIHKLLSESPAGVETSEDNPITNDVEYHDAPSSLRIPRVLGREKRIADIEDLELPAPDEIKIASLDPLYPDLSKSLPSYERKDGRLQPDEVLAVDEQDTRTPLERWRSRPRKALSVTDIVSPAWCELQYFYTLKYLGKKRRTAAMKQGSVVHQDLEDQIYTTVQIEISTKEDAWGLRIWNVIQGLRTLQETGQTRELEVWGIVHGQVVNGVIDELSYTCPDTELEEKLGAKDTVTVPADQTSIADFFNVNSTSSNASTIPKSKRGTANKVYLCDVKTRSGRTLPSGAAFKPTQYQLMVYHRLASDLAADKVDFSVLCERYDLNASTQFSDSFIAQIGSLNDRESFGYHDHEDSGVPISSQDSISTLLAHNSLSSLWTLMISTFQDVLPRGVSSMGHVLKAEYRSRDTGKILGRKTFPMDNEVLEGYLNSQMEWWQGQRSPKGVVLEDAFKCRSCDFAEKCEWRLERLEEDKARARANKAKRNSEDTAVTARGEIKRVTRASTPARGPDGVTESMIPSDTEG